MPRGSEAKNFVENKIREAFGDMYVATIDKKIYINAPEGGDTVQVCVSMTCPKIPITSGNPVGEGGMDFENMPTNGVTAPTEFKPAEITKEETENIRKLLAELGL